MKKFINWLESDFAPKLTKVNNNVWVVTLKDSIMQTLPFILVGSVFCLLTIPGAIFGWSWWPNFWTPFGWTMGMLSLFISFLIPFNLMEKKRLRKQRFIAALSGVVTFLIIISPQVIKDETIGFGHSAMGAGGMFIAIVAGVFAGLIMQTFGKFSFFEDDSVIPDFVKAWFDAMLPVGTIITIAWIVVDILKVDVYNIVLSLFMPLASIIESPWGFVLLMTAYCFLYSMGVSSWVLTPVTKPIFLAAITANAVEGASNLVTSETIFSTYLWVGGIGCTFPLVVLMLRSKSKKLSALGKACLVPSLFNINEPVVFGVVAWNPIMMLPMWLTGFILPAVTWIFTKIITFAPVPKVVFDLWYVPFPIATWMTTNGSLTALALMLLNLVIATFIWFPFFKTYEKQCLVDEA